MKASKSKKPSAILEEEESHLRSSILSLKERYTTLSDDNVFVLWFLLARITRDESAARKAMTGGSGDGGMDAVYFDHKRDTVFIVQGKFREQLNAGVESGKDVSAFASLAKTSTDQNRRLTSFSVT